MSQSGHRKNASLHSAGIRIPILAFSLALFGDLARSVTGNPNWDRFTYLCLGVGIFTALVAAVFGFIDFSEVVHRRRARQLVMFRTALNLGAVGLYVGNLLLRQHGIGPGPESRPYLIGANLAALLTLLIAAWLGTWGLTRGLGARGSTPPYVRLPRLRTVHPFGLQRRA